MMGLPDKVWNDLYRKNPEYSAALRNSIQNETDPAKVEAMTSYIPEAQPEGITEAFMESPLTFAGGGALAYGAGKGLYGMLKKANFKGAGAIASNLKSAGPALGASFAPGLAKMMGATDYEADVAGLLGTGAATGFYGVSGASSLLRDRLAGGLIGTNDFNALKQRAQALGINQVEGKAIADIQGSKDSAKSLRTEIANKVQGQKLSKSKALLKSANVKPTTGQGASALKKAGLSKLGGKGAIGMGLLTALQLFNLAKGLYDDRGSSPFSSPSNQAMANPFREVTEVE